MHSVRRIAQGLGLAVLVIAVTPQPVSAGGGAFFEFDNHIMTSNYLATGRTVTGRMVAYFNHKDFESVRFFAYLEPRGSGGGPWNRPPNLSSDAVLLGPISIGRFKAQGSGYSAPAALTFRVPDVRPGRYLIEYCNEPCTVIFGEPDVNWNTEVTVVPTAAEARLRERIERIELRTESLVWSEDRWERRHIRNLERVVQDPDGLADQAEVFKTQNAITLQRIRELNGELRRVREETDDPSWLAYLLIAAAAAGIIVVGLRRRQRSADKRRLDRAAAVLFDDMGSRSKITPREPATRGP